MMALTTVSSSSSSSGLLRRGAHMILVLLLVLGGLLLLQATPSSSVRMFFVDYYQTMEKPTISSVTTTRRNNETLSQQQEDQQILLSPTPTTAVSDEPPPPRQYVVLSANLGKKARQEDYDYLAAVTARNWYNFGFIPIIVIVASSIEEIYDTVDLWNIILPTTRGGDHNHNRDRDDNTIIIPLVVQHHPQHQVAIAQVSRLFAVSSLVGADLLLRDEDFVRITDADMMILNPIPFEPPDDNTTDITIFNGNCCGPHEYPMHSFPAARS